MLILPVFQRPPPAAGNLGESETVRYIMCEPHLLHVILPADVFLGKQKAEKNGRCVGGQWGIPLV